MRTPVSLLLAILALVLSATALPQGQSPPPANSGSTNANSGSTNANSGSTNANNGSANAGSSPSSGNSSQSANSGLTAIFFGNAASLPPACNKLVTETVQPLLLDPECEVAKFVTGTPSTSAVLEPKLTKLCGKSCTDKAQAALRAVSQVPECGNHLTFGAAIVAAFYHYNNYCLTSSKGGNAYCALEQSKALEEAKIAANASADAWPQPVLCSECTQRQYRLVQMQPSFAGLAALSSRSNPATNKTLLTAKCGDEWIKNTEKIDLQLTVKAESGAASSSSGAAGTAGSSGTAAGSGKGNSAGKSAVTVSSMVLAAVAAVMTVAL